MPVTAPLRPGDPRELGGYRLLGRLGEGGMGAVYLGRAADERYVAVKVIKPELADQDEFRGRFRSEVNRARQVPPFCTAAVLDADPEHSTPYLVCEYVDGPSLSDIVAERGPIGGGDLYSAAIGVATALTAIHGAGVIHRDLKPRNVLFTLGSPKVIDFGLARAFEATSHHTRTDQMVGTVAYMAPERFDSAGHGVGPAADVFAWGCVITYAGTGRTPFAADSPAATAARILTQPPEIGGLPEPLRGIVARTLARRPQERPTAAALLEMLLAAGPGGGPAELRRATEAARRTPSRLRRAAGVAAAFLVVAAVLAVSVLSGGRPITGGPGAVQAKAPVIVDALSGPGQWRADGTGCAFTGDRLVVRSATAASCPGPEDIFTGDQTISVSVALLTPASCAAIGFRLAGDDGYRLTACATEITIAGVGKGRTTTLATARVPDLGRDVSHRLTLTVRAGRAVAQLDGSTVCQATVTAPAGRVALGVQTGEVAYTDVEITTG